MDPIEFPPAEIGPGRLTWVDVSDHNGLSTEKSLCLLSSSPNDSNPNFPQNAIEGFGHETTGYVLANRMNAGKVEFFRAENGHRKVRLRLIPTHIVNSERSRMRREGTPSEIFMPRFAQVMLTENQSRAAGISGYSLFLYGLNRPQISGKISAVRVSRPVEDPQSVAVTSSQSYDSNPEVVTQVLIVEAPTVYIELTDRPTIGRCLREALYGEVRDGLLLEAGKMNEEGEQTYIRPALNMIEKYPDEKKVAIKIILRAYLPGGEEHGRKRLCDDPMKEIAAMQFISKEITSMMNSIANNRHTDPNAHVEYARMQESLRHVMPLSAVLQDYSRIYMVMNLVNEGELFDKIGEFADNIDRTKMLFRHVAYGLYCLHRCGISHRDISLENALLHRDSVTGDETSFIIDFGLCHRVTGHGIAGHVRNTTKGKEYYIPPENKNPSIPSIDALACDMWALGVMLFIMMTSTAPFDQRQDGSSTVWYNTIAQGRLPNRQVRVGSGIATIRDAVDADTLTIMLGLLDTNASTRMTIDQLISHRWFQDI